MAARSGSRTVRARTTGRSRRASTRHAATAPWARRRDRRHALRSARVGAAGRGARPDRRRLARRSRWPRLPRRGASTLGVRSGIDWFELHGALDFGGVAAPLPAVLAAARKGEAFVRLDDGSLGLLPDEWLARSLRIAALGEPHDDHVRFQPAQAALLDAWLAEQPAGHVGRALRSPARRARALHGRAAGGAAADRSRARCAATSRTPWAGSRSCAGSGSAAASPTTWDSARRCWCWRARGAAPATTKGWHRRTPVARRRAAIAGVQLAAGSGALRAAAARARHHRQPAPAGASSSVGDHDVVVVDLRHAAPRHRALEGRDVRLRDPRRGAGDQERQHRDGARRRGCCADGIGSR